MAYRTTRLLWLSVLFGIVGCDGPSGPPTAPLRPDHRLLLTAADTLAVMGPAPAFRSTSAVSSSPGIPVQQGDVVTVSVVSMSNGRCETVTVSGAANATVWTGIGSPTACNRSPAPVTLPPITANGSLVFDLPLISNTSTISGGGTRYEVAFEDGYDNDYNDIVLAINIVPYDGSPRLTCTPAPMRGTDVTCQVLGDGVAVKGWHFTNGILSASDTSTARTWKGTAVVDGDVSVEVDVNGTTDTLYTSFVVAPRSWSWGPAQWSFTQGTGLPCFSQRPVVGTPINWGWNRRKGDCGVGRISPDVTKTQTDGYTVAMVPDGPNRGIWYLTAVSYRMDTESQMNLELTSAGTRYLLTNSTQARKCRTALGLKNGADVYVNFQMYNELCEKQLLTGLYNGIWAHEGMGTGTANNGHEAQTRLAASDPANNLYKLVENVSAATEGDLRRGVTAIVWDVDQRLSAQSASHTYVKDNWCGSVWMWSNTSNAYVTAQVLTDLNNCI